MKYLIYVILCVIYFNYLLAVEDANNAGEPDDEEIEKFNEDSPYCYRFTWLGPGAVPINYSCNDFLYKRLPEAPCRQPYVITNDSTFPDTNWMWNNVRNRVICKPKGSEVCVKYTYSFAGAALNATFMCAKAATKDESSIPYGCYDMVKDGYTISACMCKSTPGYRPCNGSVAGKYLSNVLLLFALLLPTYSQLMRR